ncbi:MAG: CRISPR-associated protein Csm6 [Lachnospiraceae bacterium]|nr:CRISPR-associated protein Csm6 [Lachnospiraceae bacterium]
MSRILFSPIGGSDPIRNFRDGSMLHICRNYLPDQVYLYLSYEMCVHHEKDDRYRYCIEKLEEQCGHHFDVKVIEREDLKDVQDYEIFYEDFRKCIADIVDGMNVEDELLLNVSSGTPAMKNALVVLSSLAEFPFKPIQVSTPLRRINHTDENIDRYEVEEQWECNEDNEAKNENRCTEVQSANLLTLWKVNIIKKHLRAYDYSAAYHVAKEMEGRLSEECVLYLEQALERMRLNSSKVNRIAKQTGYQPMPVTKDEDRILVEFILNLQVKEKRGTYDDFFRGITPAILDLLERALKYRCRVDINQFCSSHLDNVCRWDKKKLAGSEALDILDDAYGGKGRFRPGPIYSAHLRHLILGLSDEEKLKKQAEDLRQVEEKVRNTAAHTMTPITQDLVKRWTKYTTGEILQMMKNFTRFAGIKEMDSGEIWNSYDKMNEQICKVLEKNIQFDGKEKK